MDQIEQVHVHASVRLFCTVACATLRPEIMGGIEACVGGQYGTRYPEQPTEELIS